ncbi:MAG: putative peptide transport system permease protein [Frankiales bacterium]|jgi:peptide/nickel transport system permease protein|nr:putative peptide transport system permease protein [Frankiales bacterium]
MGRFIARRLLFGVVVLFVISLAVFVLFFVVAPGDPAANFVGKSPTPEQIQQAKVRYGLDKPVPEQYLQYVGRLLHGDLGYSFRNAEPVRKTLLDRLPATASLAGGAAVVWLLMGIPIGILAATKPRSIRDRLATVFALGGLSIPPFVAGLLLLYFLYYRLSLNGLDIFPASGYVPLTQNPFEWARHLILPWFALALVTAASYSRITRGSLLEVLGEDYIRTARAKGLSERRVIYRHGLRSALTPVVTLLGIDVGTLLGGAIVTEVVFGLQGIGQNAIVAVSTGDLPVIFGTVLFAAFFIVIANILVDIAYAVLDSRVRLA